MSARSALGLAAQVAPVTKTSTSISRLGAGSLSSGRRVLGSRSTVSPPSDSTTMSSMSGAQVDSAPLAPRIPMPSIIYGTAWKGPASTPLVFTALRTGFRAVDTAAQLKHYDEAAVGQGIRDALAAAAAADSSESDFHGLTRSQLWIQTKCTPPAGQDWSRPVPYERHDRPADAVRKSFALSLWNLATDEEWRRRHPPPVMPAAEDAKGKQRDFSGSSSEAGGSAQPSPLDVLSDAAVSLLPQQGAPGAASGGERQGRPEYPAPGSSLHPHLRPRTSVSEPYIDSYLLHSPFDSVAATIEAWREMENLVRLGWIRRIGLSNVYDPHILQYLRQHFVNTPSIPLNHAELGGGPTYPIAPTILQNRWHSSTLHDVGLFSLLSPTLDPNDFSDIAGRIASQKEAAQGALQALRDSVPSLEPRQLEAEEPTTDDPAQIQPVTYQAFWILTGNPNLLTRSMVHDNVDILNSYLSHGSNSAPSPERTGETELQRAIRTTRWTPQMLLYATVSLSLGGVMGLSTSVLCGSTDVVHMREALVAVHRAEQLRAAESGRSYSGVALGPKEREREEAANAALRVAVEAIRREVYGE